MSIKKIVSYIASKFDTTAQRIEDVPIIGRYLAKPFFFFSDSIDLISNYLDYVNDAWEWLKKEFLALPSFEDLLKALEGHYGILTKTPLEIYGTIEVYIPEIPSIEDIIERVLSRLPDIPTIETVTLWISDAFETILDKLFEEGK